MFGFRTRRKLARMLNLAEKANSDLQAENARLEKEIKKQVGLKVKYALKIKDLEANLKKAVEERDWHAKHKGEAAKEKDKWHKKFDIETLKVSDLTRKLELANKELEEVNGFNATLGQESFERQRTIENLQATLKTRGSQAEKLQRQIPDPGVAKSRSGKNYTPYVAFPDDSLSDDSDDEIFYSAKHFKTEEEAWFFVNNLYLPADERVGSVEEWKAIQDAKIKETEEAFETIGGERD